MSADPVETGRRLVGQRRCVHCEHGLKSQPILHDRDYEIFLARCPECGRHASLGDPPPLRRGARLLTAVLAAAWLLAVAGVWLAGGSGLSAFGIATAEIGAEGYRRYLTDAFSLTMNSPEGEAIVRRSLRTGAVISGRTRTSSFETWWTSQDKAATLAAAGGVIGVVNWSFLYMWIPAAVAAFIVGCFWGVVLAGRRLAARLLAILLVIAPAATMVVSQIALWNDPSITWVGGVARAAIGPSIALATMVMIAIVLAIGVAAGPAMARLAIRQTTAPRARRPFVALGLRE